VPPTQDKCGAAENALLVQAKNAFQWCGSRVETTRHQTSLKRTGFYGRQFRRERLAKLYFAMFGLGREELKTGTRR